jgi:hypothetical protein
MRASVSVPGPTKLSLTPELQGLLEVMQRVRYGVIHAVPVVNGQPVLRDLRWTQTVKVLGTNVPHPASRSHDFCLREEVVAFVRFLTELGNGVILNLELRNGLPFSFQLGGGMDE